MTPKTARKMVSEYDGDDLTRKQLLRLAEARMVLEPTRERVDRHGWTVEIRHYLHDDPPMWGATAWRTGTTYAGETCVASNTDESTCRAEVERFFALLAAAGPTPDMRDVRRQLREGSHA